MSAIWHFIKLAHRIRPSYTPLAALSAVLSSVTPFVNIVMPRYILNELIGLKRTDKLIIYVSILIIGNAVLSLINSIVTKKLQISGEKLADGFELHVGNHIMHMDFEKLEDAKILNMKEKALFNIRLHKALLGGPKTIISLFQMLFTIIGVIAIIAILSPLLVVVMIILIVVNSLIYKHIQTTKIKFYNDIAIYNRQFAYYRDLTQNFNNAKEVRIYNMSEYIINRINLYHDSVNNIFNKMFLKQRKHDGLSAVNIQVQTIATYAYAVWSVFKGTIKIGDFSMYISAANQFSNVTSQFMINIIDLRMLSKILWDYLDFEQLPNNNVNGTKTVSDVKNVKIEFKNVWFKYPNIKNYTLKNVSLTINNGERISIVGKNGAGKTTFIKLLCRLYRPNKGCILLNGTDINEFEESEYIKLLSVIFQDYKIFSFTVKENLAFNETADEKRVLAALEQADVLNKIEDLPLGIDTPLYKNFDSNGEELSGGEMQKIAIARVLYKNTPLVILDEPTAALDPYSEYEIYSQFNSMTNGKTTIYISHRLSSCRFCDKIAVFDDGMLVEYGDHEHLVSDGKLYAEMWKVQAQYYQ
jgi:ATP-binding cassette subfamily B protein/ATP-binding cassette subfamily C protein